MSVKLIVQVAVAVAEKNLGLMWTTSELSDDQKSNFNMDLKKFN